MVISDIMLYNWVSYKGINHRVLKIVGDDVILDSTVGVPDENIIANISDCKPINLQKEHLVECGFLEAKEKYVLDSGDTMIILSWSDEDKEYTLSVGLCNMSMKVWYVHQLQQLLKVHGYENIDIDLNKSNCEYRVGNWIKYKDDFCKIVDICATENVAQYKIM